jgi:hypothetical protein
VSGGPADRQEGARDRFERALARIDAANAEDPEQVPWEGGSAPRALAWGRRMSAWLARLAPAASEPLRLAVRAQHLRRWTVPRGRFPAGRQGYLQWRSTLARQHADEAGRLLHEEGYDDAAIERVGQLIRKVRLRSDPETQLLEDAACLAFFEQDLAGFAAGHDRARVVEVLRKTWDKMSPAARALAVTLPLSGDVRDLVEEAQLARNPREDGLDEA